MKDKYYAIYDIENRLVGVAIDKHTKEEYEKQGYKVEKTKLLEEVNKNISEVKFKIIRICEKSTDYSGTILNIFRDIFYMDKNLNDKKINDDYIPFKDFLQHADEKNKEHHYRGEVNADILANMFIDSCNTKEYEYKFIKCNYKISKRDIIKYIESLYINEKRYVDDFGYDKFFGME